MLKAIDTPELGRVGPLMENSEAESEPQQAIHPLQASAVSVVPPNEPHLNAMCLLRLPQDILEIIASPALLPKRGDRARLSGASAGMLKRLTSTRKAALLCRKAESVMQYAELHALLQEIAAIPVAYRPGPLTQLSRKLPWINETPLASKFDDVYKAVRQLRPVDRLLPMRDLAAAAPTISVFLTEIPALPEADQGFLFAALIDQLMYSDQITFDSVLSALESRLKRVASDHMADHPVCIAHANALERLAENLESLCYSRPAFIVPPYEGKHRAFRVCNAIANFPGEHCVLPMMALIRNMERFLQEDWFSSFSDRILHASVALPVAFQCQLLAYAPRLPSTVSSRFLRSALHAIASLSEGEVKCELDRHILKFDALSEIDILERHRAVIHCFRLLPADYRDDMVVQLASTLHAFRDSDLPALYELYMPATRQMRGEWCNEVLFSLARLKGRFSTALSIRSHFEILTEMMRVDRTPDNKLLSSLAMTMDAVIDSELFQSGMDYFFAASQRVPRLDANFTYILSFQIRVLQDSTRLECLMRHALKCIAAFNDLDAYKARCNLMQGVDWIVPSALRAQARQMLAHASSAADGSGKSTLP